QNVNLIFVGKDDFFYKRLEKQKFPDLVFLHDVSDSELYHLYSNSIAAVSASLMEGFGLLPLEAFGAGTIATVSNIPAFTEVCGESAIYFNPQDPDDIAKKLIQVNKLSNSERENLIKKGKAVVGSFSWEKMAKETLQVYESCAGLRQS
ncbi:MAG: glycosyltransferase, partial [Candidatus Levyibacteriota bacterium]